MRLASVAVSALTRAGARVRARMWRSCSFSHRVVGHEFAFQAAGGDDRDFPLERDETLQNHRRRAQRCPMDCADVGAFADQRLALAVVTEPAGLQDRGAAELGDCARQRPRILDPDKGRGLKAEIA